MLSPGTNLGVYEIVEPIGKGGMGEVYRAVDTRLDRTVAIKVLPSHLAEDPTLRERFEREARAVSALNHPNVCSLYDVHLRQGSGVGDADDVDYLVMELLEGETLSERLKRGGLPLDEALTVGKQVADALDKAHRHGVVHRDLKPGNVMLTKSGAKLLDFGLAKQSATDPDSGEASSLSALPTAAKDLTAKGAILGTFQYMAPEQLEGEPVSAQTDIFALGLILFEMVTGRKAFGGKSQASLISAIMSADPPSLSSLQPRSPRGLDAIVRTCLEKSPEARWSSAGDVARQLENLSGASAEPAHFPRRQERSPLRFGSIAALAGVAVGALGIWIASPVRNAEEPLRRFSILAPEGTSLRGNMELSPDGRTLWFIAFEDGEQRLYRHALDGWESTHVPDVAGARDLSVSPDGQWLAFGEPGRMKKVSLTGGAPVTLAEVNAGNASSWGESARIAFGSTNPGTIYLVSENGGQPEALTEPSDPAWDPKWLPGGEAMLLASGRGIEALDVATGERSFLIEGDSPRYAHSGHVVFARGTTLWAVPFDAAALELLGDAVPILEGVARNSRYSRYAVDAAGTLVFLPAEAGVQRTLVWVDEVGRATPIDGIPPDDYWIPRLSPDSAKAAVVSLDDVWVADLERGTRRQLTFDGVQRTPGWSPDGTSVLYTAVDDSGGGWGLYRKAERAADAEPVVVGEGLRAWDIAPDGELIVFNRAAMDADLNLWTEASGVETIEETPTFEGAPRVDPTGRYIAYSSNATGQVEVYVVALDGYQTWLISSGGGNEAVWSRDGRTLFYRNNSEMWSVPITLDPEFEPGEPVLLFDVPYGATPNTPSTSLANYDVAPDGRFLMIQGVGPSNREIRVITGLHGELERLAPAR